MDSRTADAILELGDDLREAFRAAAEWAEERDGATLRLGATPEERAA
jgi:DNA-binding HxlR family transcriptional regulator